MMVQEWLVRGTAWCSLGLYLLALVAWRFRTQAHWWTISLVRLLWTAGWLVLIVHVLLAFDCYHGWSHEAAWQRTQEQSGWGGGIYFNYALVILWTGDMAWWWIFPAGYLRRPRWVGVILQGFLLFMWFNAAVVFAIWPMPAVGAVLFLVLGISVALKQVKA